MQALPGVSLRPARAWKGRGDFPGLSFMPGSSRIEDVVCRRHVLEGSLVAPCL